MCKCKPGETKQIKYVKKINKNFTYLCKYKKFKRKLYNIVKYFKNYSIIVPKNLMDYVIMYFYRFSFKVQ